MAEVPAIGPVREVEIDLAAGDADLAAHGIAFLEADLPQDQTHREEADLERADGELPAGERRRLMQHRLPEPFRGPGGEQQEKDERPRQGDEEESSADENLDPGSQGWVPGGPAGRAAPSLARGAQRVLEAKIIWRTGFRGPEARRMDRCGGLWYKEP